MTLLRHSLLTAALLALAASASAQTWSSLNPGAGGQIQEVVLDPTQANRAYVLSDVEGMYRTTDGGATYTPVLNGLTTVDVLTGVVDPRNGKVYIGTNLGLLTSAAGGGRWTTNATINPGAQGELITQDGGKPGAKLHVGSIVLAPDNAEFVAAGIGDKRFSETKRATVFYSTNAGGEFTRKDITTISSGNANVLQLAAGGGLLFAAAQDAGLWVSRTWGYDWTRVASPAGGPATGVAVSPDGRAVYATFGAGRQIYAATADYGRSGSPVGSWTTLPVNNGVTYASTSDSPAPDFRNLQVDPRSAWPEHKLLTGTGRGFPRDGLAEVTVTWSGTTPSGTWRSIFDYGAPRYDESPAPAFETGWEGNDPNPYAYAYAPLSWPGRQIWSTTDQTLFKVDTRTSNYTQRWEQIYTNRVSTAGGIETWHDRGWVSTVDFDADQYGQAVCSAKGDHGVMMSWDGGASWEVESTPQFLAADQFGQQIVGRSNSCRFVRTPSGALYVVAHLTTGYGAGAVNGQLWGSKLDPANPQPAEWVFLAGGNGGAGRTPANLPDNRIDYIEQNPHNRNQVFLAVRDAGVYAIDNLDALYNARANGGSVPNLYRLGGTNAPSSPTEKDNTVRMDPNDPNALFVANGFEVLRGTRSGGGWSWASVCGSGAEMKMDVWDRAGTTMLACRVYSTEDRAYFVRVSSSDGGWEGNASWFDRSSLTSLRTPAMVPALDQQQIWNLAGSGDKLYVNVQQNSGGLVGYGIFEITVAADATLSAFKDVTGGVIQPRSIRMRTVEENGNRWLFLASWGAGTWRRPITGDVAGGPGPDPDPEPPTAGAPQPGVWYTLRNADHGLVLASNAGGSTFSKSAGTTADKQWQVVAGANGAFLIDNREGGRGPLETVAPSTVRWVADGSGATAARLWTFVPASGGGFYVKSQTGDPRYLRANPDGGTFYDPDPKVGTRWEFVAVDGAPTTPEPPAPPAIEAGVWYTLRNVDRAQFLDADGGGAVALKGDQNGTGKQWEFVGAGGGAYRIDNRRAGRGPLDTNGDGGVRWAADGATGSDKTWTAVDAGDGTFRFQNAAAGRGYLVGNADGSVRWTAGAGAGTRWQLVRVGGAAAQAALAADAVGAAAPDALVIASVGPNPTRGALRVRFGVPSSSEVSVEVYDVRGRRVVERTVSAGAGWHGAEVPTASLSPGVYLVRLTAGAETATQRFTVVR